MNIKYTLWHKGFLSLLLLNFLLLAGCGGLAKEKRNIVKKIALSQVGVKYKYGGYNPKMGFDCSGLVYYSYKQAGYNIPRTVNRQYSYSSKVFFFKKPGDLIFFNVKQRWWKPWGWFNVTHVGIYLGDGKMVHAPKTGKPVVVVHDVYNSKYWSKYYRNTRRIIE